MKAFSKGVLNTIEEFRNEMDKLYEEAEEAKKQAMDLLTERNRMTAEIMNETTENLFPVEQYNEFHNLTVGNTKYMKHKIAEFWISEHQKQRQEMNNGNLEEGEVQSAGVKRSAEREAGSENKRKKALFLWKQYLSGKDTDDTDDSEGKMVLVKETVKVLVPVLQHKQVTVFQWNLNNEEACAIPYGNKSTRNANMYNAELGIPEFVWLEKICCPDAVRNLDVTQYRTDIADAVPVVPVPEKLVGEEVYALEEAFW
jgi:hypothetical protein